MCVRLFADAPVKDLMKSSVTSSSDLDIIKENVSKMRLDRSTYFYIPGSVLHIDGDDEYLDRCMNFYKEMNIKANGICLNENDMPSKIKSLLEEYNPDIVTLSDEENYEDKTMIDYSSDEISTAEAEALIETLNEELGSDTIEFHAGISYRHILIIHGGNADVKLTPPHDITGKKVTEYLPF